jgi:uncharacterized protein (DUF1330 family)
MPKAYVIYQEQINDNDAMNTYAAAAMATFPGSGGTIAGFDDNVEVLEGEWFGNRTVILEFESVEAAKAWYNSPAYQEAIPLRQKAGDSNVAIVTGFGA